MTNSTAAKCRARKGFDVHHETDTFHVGNDGSVYFTDTYLRIPSMDEFCIDQLILETERQKNCCKN